MTDLSFESRRVIGMDVHDRKTSICILNGTAVVERLTLKTDRSVMRAAFSQWSSSLVVMEVGKQSPWLSRLIQSCGHEVVVANPRKLLKSRSQRKSDRQDAEHLARLGRLDRSMLHPVKHRSERAQAHLAVIRARQQVVEARTKLINSTRGMVKSFGYSLPKCDAKCFASRVQKEGLPPELCGALEPMVDVIAQMTSTIKEYNKEIEGLCKDEYPETEILRQIRGVGAQTALAFRLVLDDPTRFRRSRSVGAYLGMVPGLHESGTQSRALHISKQGDPLLRRLLTQGAQYILGPFGEDCDLRRHGESILERSGGAPARRRAVVAVARKLAVLMHRLWVAGETYDPLYNAKRLQNAA